SFPQRGFAHPRFFHFDRFKKCPVMNWLIAGGIIFTLGALVYSTKTMDFKPGVFGFHEVWHIFVIAGALAHFVMIAFYIAPASI
ncbi:MAG TPA: hypothetical protein EYP88_03060, partial [Anaerolineales bacterium]|nr:hypothetical protein [Anaerolineales bacterium]